MNARRLGRAARAAVKRLVPEASPLYPLLRAAYRASREAPARVVDLATPPVALEDVHDGAAWRRLLAAHHCPPWRADPKAGRAGAAGLVIELAMREAARFPRALSDGLEGDFARWLCDTHTARASSHPVADLRAVLADPPGERVLSILRGDVRLRQAHPWALTPYGREAWLRWLLNPLRRSRLELEAHHLAWFVLACAEDETLGMAPTWLIDPALQQRLPGSLEEIYPRLRALASEELGLGSLPSELPERWRTPTYTSPWRSFVPGQPIAGVNLLGYMAHTSGLGEAARNTARAARIVGLDVSERDIPLGFEAHRPLALGLEHHPLTLMHVPGGGCTEHAHRDAGLWRRPGVYRIGVWYWELERLPSSWRDHGAWLDEIWCPTTFIAEAARRDIAIPVVPMFPGIEVPRFEPRTRDDLGLPPARFLFLFMFDMASYWQRKNPLAVIRAFARAFRAHEPVGLVIKVSRGHIDPEAMQALRAEAAHADVTILDQVLAREATYALMQSCEAYVSLHRSEGFGLTLAEAMTMGKPVIATGYSGNLDFMSAEVAHLVPYRLVPIERAVGPYAAGGRWAEPDIDEAARCMRRVYDDRAGAAAMGQRARAAITSLTSLEAYAERIARRLEVIRQGPRLPASNEVRELGVHHLGHELLERDRR